MKTIDELSIDSLLSWKDIINLGAPVKDDEIQHHLANADYLFKNKYSKSLFDESFDKYIVNEFLKLGPPNLDKLKNLLPQKTKFELFLKENEDGTYSPKFSKEIFLTNICFTNIERYDEVSKEETDNIYNTFRECKNDGELKEAVLKILKEKKNKYIGYIRELEKQKINIGGIYLPRTIINDTSAVDENIRFLTEAKELTIWYIKNIDRIFEFINRDYPMEVIEKIDKDKYLIDKCYIGFYKMCIKNGIKSNNDLEEYLKEHSEDVKETINYINDFVLLVDYLEKDSNKKYTKQVDYGDNYKNYELPIITKDYLKEIVSEISKTADKNCFKHKDAMDVLKDIAIDKWKEIRKKEQVKNITVNFEIIPSGRIYVMDKVKSSMNTKRKVDKEGLEKALKLLEDKLTYYESREPVLNLSGIGKFTGYFAKFYENGCVVLDKYYNRTTDRNGKEKIKVVRNEGIYVMNYENFADLCQCDKQELIEERKNNNHNVLRKNHNENWKENMDEIIYGPGYGELDLELLDLIVDELKEKKM